jgi:hypothetical protein
MLHEYVYSAKHLQQIRLRELAGPVNRRGTPAPDARRTQEAPRPLRSAVGKGLIALGRRLVEGSTEEVLERAA